MLIMLRIKTYVAPSPIHGLGLFAGQDIAAGEKIWQFDYGVDIMMTVNALKLLPKKAYDHLIKHGWQSITQPNTFFMCSDEFKYANHAAIPNIDDHGDSESIAACDISARTELTVDYSSFNANSGIVYGGSINVSIGKPIDFIYVSLDCEHEYPNPWHAIIPPACKKCGLQARTFNVGF